MALPKQYRFKADALPADMFSTNAALRRLGVMKVKGYQFTADDLDQYGLEEVLPHSSGDVRTGRCVMDEQLGYLVPEWESFTKETLVRKAKEVRNESNVASLTITLASGSDASFDTDDDAKENIKGTIEDYEPLRLRAVSKYGWPDDGTFPWVTSDNKTVAVVLADLQKLLLDGKFRKLDNHMTYQAAKASIGV